MSSPGSESFAPAGLVSQLPQVKHPLPTKPNFTHSPVSPPLSTAASNVDNSAISSPNPFVITPPGSAPMTAQPSYQTPAMNYPDESATTSQGTEQISQESENMDTTMYDSSMTSSTSSTKRKLESQEPDRESNKRQRTGASPSFAPSHTGETAPKLSATLFPKLFKLPHPKSQPHATDNLFNLYNLNSIAASVARKNDKGEKINKLRKSYEGKVKELAGRNKATPTPNDLTGLALIPEEEWYSQNVHGKSVESGLTDDFLANLEKAVKMEPGKLPQEEHDKWQNILALEDPASKSSNQPATSNPKPGVRPVANGVNKAQYATEPPRPKRRGTKRHYNDDSFEGYGETFDDDGDTMSLDGDDDRRGLLYKKEKRRKKESAGSPHFSSSMGQYTQTPVSVGNPSISGR